MREVKDLVRLGIYVDSPGPFLRAGPNTTIESTIIPVNKNL